MLATRAEFEIDDAKSVADNHDDLIEKLKELDPVLGPILASFLPQLTKDPAGEKATMLTALRAELDKSAATEAQQ